MIFGWEPWADVACFNFGDGSFLVQGRKHRRTGAAGFRIVTACGVLQGAAAGVLTKDNLLAAGLWNTRAANPSVEGRGGEEDHGTV